MKFEEPVILVANLNSMDLHEPGISGDFTGEFGGTPNETVGPLFP